jgi:hypothetical protein
MQNGGLNPEETRFFELYSKVEQMPALIRMRPSDKNQYRQFTQEIINFYKSRVYHKEDDYEHCISFYEHFKALSQVRLTRKINYTYFSKMIN